MCLLLQINIFLIKKRRMRILGARIFSKFFGGKIENVLNTLRFFFKKKINRRMRILSARIFSKFFGGKILIFNISYTYYTILQRKQTN